MMSTVMAFLILLSAPTLVIIWIIYYIQHEQDQYHPVLDWLRKKVRRFKK